MTDSSIAKNYQANDNCLANRIILVTGAGDGIGRTAALTFASYGAEVILVGRTVAKLEQVYDEIVASGAPKPAIYPMDLEGATEDHYQEMAGKLFEEFGRLDGLLHNAGLLGQRTPIANYKLSTWQQVMQVNVTAGFAMTKALLPLLEKSEDSSIIFTSSGVGRVGRAYWGAYAVSKFATEGLCQVLAQELEGVGNIRVNCINPGATRTAMRAGAYPAEDPGTLPAPADIMPTYLYLMSAESQGVSGESLDAQ
ncbi:YciK family oxidoreductase [Porticoccus sp. W117]|uniref:YciK family oxidoreductase n=1 Tax=Porticoccus sp. W117 TaxID=3054777 RepID=UPI0025986331|nr:YciK family oxidoreductase [Porticoccus sp. W117]MDM3872094.1 YciK family oxidoreductase [Porticoccus sp. W117]